MRFGIQIEPQFGFSFAEIAQIARDAEELGADALWVSDHLFLNDASAEQSCLEAWTLLAALTQVTTRLRLGTMVTCQSFRNPALLAKIAAGVDHMSEGRLEFGIGTGWKELEYRAYGYGFPPAGVRVDQMRETIEICVRMWSEDRATYQGKHYRIDAAQCMPKPVQRPLPVWIAGEKPRIMRAAARYAHAVNVGGWPTAERYAASMAELERACAAIGRDPATVVRSHFFPALVAPTQDRVDEIADALATRAGVARDVWLGRRRGHPVGTPEAAAEALRPYAALGVTYLIPVFPYGYDRECLRVFAREVVPLLS